jgi:hypothetical protein
VGASSATIRKLPAGLKRVCQVKEFSTHWQPTQNEAVGAGHVLSIDSRVAVDIRWRGHVVAREIRGEIGPSDHAPIEPLAGGGSKSHRQSNNQPSSAHGRPVARSGPERKKADYGVFNGKLGCAVGLSGTSDY